MSTELHTFWRVCGRICFSLPFPAKKEAVCIIWPRAPFLHLQLRQHSIFSDLLSLLFKASCDFLDTLRYTPHSRSLIMLATFLLLRMAAYLQVPGIRLWTSLRGHYSESTIINSPHSLQPETTVPPSLHPDLTVGSRL